MKVAVIGTGPCGLAAIKACLEEGLEVAAFDLRNDVGGVWNYSEGDDDADKDDATKVLSSVMRTTVTNISKELMGYSDFLVPREFPQYLPHQKMHAYLKMYADHFRLTEHIRFETEVIRVGQVDDGRWEVTSRKLGSKDDEPETETFDAVMISVGHEAVKFVPEVDGREDFAGQILHTGDYRCMVLYILYVKFPQETLKNYSLYLCRSCSPHLRILMMQAPMLILSTIPAQLCRVLLTFRYSNCIKLPEGTQ